MFFQLCFFNIVIKLCFVTGITTFSTMFLQLCFSYSPAEPAGPQDGEPRGVAGEPKWWFSIGFISILRYSDPQSVRPAGRLTGRPAGAAPEKLCFPTMFPQHSFVGTKLCFQHSWNYVFSELCFSNYVLSTMFSNYVFSP